MDHYLAGAASGSRPHCDPKRELHQIAVEVAGVGHALADAKIAKYADRVKCAMIALRAGTYPDRSTRTSSERRLPDGRSHELLAALAALFAAARGRESTPELLIA